MSTKVTGATKKLSARTSLTLFGSHRAAFIAHFFENLGPQTLSTPVRFRLADAWRSPFLSNGGESGPSVHSPSRYGPPSNYPSKVSLPCLLHQYVPEVGLLRFRECCRRLGSWCCASQALFAWPELGCGLRHATAERCTVFDTCRWRD